MQEPYYMIEEPPLSSKRVRWEMKMEGGCLRCRAESICPDCFHCIRCGNGCAQCHRYHRRHVP